MRVLVVGAHLDDLEFLWSDLVRGVDKNFFVIIIKKVY